MYPIQYIADTNILWKIINNSIFLSGYSNPMKFPGDPIQGSSFHGIL